MNIPTLDAYTLPSAADAMERRREAAKALQHKEANRLQQRAEVKAGERRGSGVVGYMRTIQADRRDAAIMAQFARARHREDNREHNVNMEAGATW